MAKGDDEPLMSPAEIKPLLMLSKRGPISCAIGMTKEKSGVILLDKKAKPRKMLSLIKKKAASANLNLDMATVRFGQALVDTAVDSALVQFVVNKETPGTLRPKLLEQLKKVGFSKCEIRVDEGLDAEPEDTADDEADAPAPSAKPAAAEAEAASAPPAPEGDAAIPGTSAITQRLTALTKQMIAGLGSNPATADAMKTAAMAGQAALKSGDLATATTSADALERMLGAASPPAAGGAKNPPGSPVFTKARATWVATRSKVESELEKLHDQLQATYKGHGVVTDLEKSFRSTVEPMLAQFDTTLSDKLDEVMKATDQAAHAKLVTEAQQIITKYEGFLSSNTLIGNLDKNPFVPLSIQKTINASLVVLSKSIA